MNSYNLLEACVEVVATAVPTISSAINTADSIIPSLLGQTFDFFTEMMQALTLLLALAHP